MVYSRLVEKYGPYLYKSVREGEKVHSIYLGPDTKDAKKEPEKKKPYTTTEDKPLPEPEKEKVKVEKTRTKTKLTHLERLHLLSFVKKFGIDRQEIDLKINYEENKEYLDKLAQQSGASKEAIKGEDAEGKYWAQEYKKFLEHSREEKEAWEKYDSTN